MTTCLVVPAIVFACWLGAVYLVYWTDKRANEREREVRWRELILPTDIVQVDPDAIGTNGKHEEEIRVVR